MQPLGFVFLFLEYRDEDFRKCSPGRAVCCLIFRLVVRAQWRVLGLDFQILTLILCPFHGHHEKSLHFFKQLGSCHQLVDLDCSLNSWLQSRLSSRHVGKWEWTTDGMGHSFFLCLHFSWFLGFSANQLNEWISIREMSTWHKYQKRK